MFLWRLLITKLQLLMLLMLDELEHHQVSIKDSKIHMTGGWRNALNKIMWNTLKLDLH